MSTGKTVLITGASTGIGRATAELFHRNGWQVAATMRSPEAGKHLAALDRVAVIKLDVTDEASIDVGVAAAAERFGGIDVLVNNAGFGLYGPLESIPVAGCPILACLFWQVWVGLIRRGEAASMLSPTRPTTASGMRAQTRRAPISRRWLLRYPLPNLHVSFELVIVAEVDDVVAAEHPMFTRPLLGERTWVE